MAEGGRASRSGKTSGSATLPVLFAPSAMEFSHRARSDAIHPADKIEACEKQRGLLR